MDNSVINTRSRTPEIKVKCTQRGITEQYMEKERRNLVSYNNIFR